MSMNKCKCDKIYDSDDEFGVDNQGNSCCDNCYEEILAQMENDIEVSTNEAAISSLNAAWLAEKLLKLGYRKILA